ncbi:solute:sodium symporter family transporter [Fulvimarina sp. MAC8]|uniref:solute:sodium symporter family transporter n=1 Tax=Fulvimarina sp. MAC8 TaxID=3162874 RepID=UPI0032EE246A
MNVVTIGSFLAFTAFVAIASYFWVRGTDEGTSDGYFLGGRSLTGVVIAGSLLLTNLSTEQIVGLNGQAFQAGVAVMAWETTSAIALVFTAFYLLPRYLKGGISTISEFIGERFDHLTRTLVAALFLIGYIVFFLPTVLYSGALALGNIFDVSGIFGVGDTVALWITVWALGLVGSVYAVAGGLKAVAVSDTINAVGLFTGGLLIPIFGLAYIGDGSILSGWSTLWEAHPEKFDARGGEDSLLPFSVLFTGLIFNQLFYWGTNQAIVQRAFAAKNLREGQKGLLLAGLFKVLVPFIVVLPGIIAFHIFQGELQNPDDAYPALVAEVLPTWLLGFFAAVLFGAILSSFNSVLNSSVTLFGIDIYRQQFRPEASDAEVVRAGKICGIVLAILAMTIAPFIANAPEGLYSLLQELNGAYSIPILSVVLIGYMTKWVPAIGANIALVFGLVFYCVSQFIVAPYFGDAYPHFLHIQAINFAICVAIMLVASKLRPRSDAFKLASSGAVEMDSWKMAPIAGVLVTTLVIGTYFIFTG